MSLPATPVDEVEAGHDGVVFRLRDELQESLAELKAIRSGALKPRRQPLAQLDLWILTAVYCLGGAGKFSLTIADKVNELSFERIRYFQVTDSMLRLSKLGTDFVRHHRAGRRTGLRCRAVWRYRGRGAHPGTGPGRR